MSNTSVMPIVMTGMALAGLLNVTLGHALVSLLSLVGF